jgi:hypothetical protein
MKSHYFVFSFSGNRRFIIGTFMNIEIVRFKRRAI